MSTKGKRPMRALTPSDKIEAIQRVNDGESKASVARDIGVPESTLRGWCKNEDKLRYMTSRMTSSPDTDKSNDGEVPEKRARTESPIAPLSPAATGLDLTTPSPMPLTAQQISPSIDVPVELTTKRLEPLAPAPLPLRERKPDPGATASMSAISPQRPSLIPSSGIPLLPAYSHLGASYNDIATNLSLLAQLNPSLSSLSSQSGSRTLRSVRSPKPAHNGALNLNETKHRSKSHHSDPYRSSSSKSVHHSATGSQSVDDTLWYWQAMLNLTAQTTASHHPLQLGKTVENNISTKPVAPTAPVNPQLDYNRNSWLWQYYKQFGGAMALPDDKIKSASQVPKGQSIENILYSHLTKGKTEEKEDRPKVASPVLPVANEKENARETSNEDQQVVEPVMTSTEGTEIKDSNIEKHIDPGKNQAKARTVLDNLLYNNNNQTASKEVGSAVVTNGEWCEANAAEALEHGEKFLAWLEASGDPTVTRMHVHQLGSLLHNLRARRGLAAAAPHAPHPPLAPQADLAGLAARRK